MRRISFYKSKSDIWYYLLGYYEIMVMCLYGDILPAHSKLMLWVQDAFDQVHGSLLFYGFNFLLLCALFVWLLYRQVKQKIFRLARLVACIVSFVLVVVCAYKHPTAIVILSLGFSFLFVAAFFELNKLFSSCTKPTDAGKNGFAIDWHKDENLQDVGWEKFAECLVERLDNTDTGSASFAVALTGSWGTGKTTFLEFLKKAILSKGQYYVEFNPWLSSSSDKIVNDFFQALNAKLKKEGVDLEDDIAKYVRLLLQWGNESIVDKIGTLPGMESHHDLASMRDRLSRGLEFLDGKLYVLIDDIDRLQKEEIFEVLKLIRHTADFANIVYVVAFDKEYVVDSLQNIPINRSAQYLQKIFQLELSFPQYESYLYTQLFNEELNTHTHYEPNLQNQVNRLEMDLNRAKIYLRDYLSNFRDVKRLVNEFVLSLDYIVKQDIISDFNVRDLFLIHLFEFTDEQGYKTFKDNVWILLNQSTSETKYFELTDDKDKLKHFEFTSKSLLLLQTMFPKIRWDHPKLHRNSINRRDKLLTYFSFRPYAYQMSLTDFSHLMKDATKEEIISYVKDSNTGIFSKAKSIYDIMREQRLSGLDTTTVSNFITLLCTWTEQNISYDSDEIGRLYRDVLKKGRVDADKVPMIKTSLSIFFEKLQTKDSGCYVLQKIYCKMMPCPVTTAYEDYFPVCIYGKEELQELLSQNTRAFLKRVNPLIDQLIKDPQLHQFLKNSVVYNDSGMRPLYDSFPIEDDLIEYFSPTKTSHDIHVLIDRFEMSKYPEDVSEDQHEALLGDICKWFVTVEFYKRFLQECFVYAEGDNTLKEYLSRNQL